MTLKNRLGRLEPSAKEAHAAGWERFWRLYTQHHDPVLRASRRTPQFAAFIEGDAAAVDYSLPEPFTPPLAELDRWNLAASAHLPDLDGIPDLTRWPDAFPIPPDEPDGLWSRCWGYLDESSTEACAGCLLMALAFARTVRDYRRSTLVPFGGDNRD